MTFMTFVENSDFRVLVILHIKVEECAAILSALYLDEDSVYQANRSIIVKCSDKYIDIFFNASVENISEMCSALSNERKYLISTRIFQIRND